MTWPNRVQENAPGKAGQIALALVRTELVVPEELDCLPLSRIGGALPFDLLSRLSEHSSVMFTTHLDFGEWSSVFDDAQTTTALLNRLDLPPSDVPAMGREGLIDDPCRERACRCRPRPVRPKSRGSAR